MQDAVSWYEGFGHTCFGFAHKLSFVNYSIFLDLMFCKYTEIECDYLEKLIIQKN